MISQKMKQMVEQSAAMSAMFTEGKRLAAIYGAENVYDFGIGNPNVKAPASVNATAIEILQNMDSLKVHSYTDSSGIPAARKAIAESLNRRFGTDYDESNLVMTVGAAGGLNVILKVLLDAGDEVLTFAPYFGEYDNYVMNVGGVLHPVPPNPPDFLPDVDALSACITAKTKAIIINSPNNPTGVIYDAGTIEKIAAVLRQKAAEYGTDIYIIADEPYRELAYDGVEVPYIPNFYENTIVAYSFSPNPCHCRGIVSDIWSFSTVAGFCGSFPWVQPLQTVFWALSTHRLCSRWWWQNAVRKPQMWHFIMPTENCCTTLCRNMAIPAPNPKGLFTCL